MSVNINTCKPIQVEIDANIEEIDSLISKRVGAKAITPELVAKDEIKAKSAYKRFSNETEKALYRQKLLNSLFKNWVGLFGTGKAEKYRKEFLNLVGSLEEKGAFILGAILEEADFQKLIDMYTKILEKSGSQSWLHSFVNLANHPEFLMNEKFNAAFLHPLLIALVSYRIGGPVRIVDGRGKDAQPIKVLAQDNMLHIDNTPFNDEYKIIVTWEKGKPSGPKGQNFVILPGTHKGARQCMIDKNGNPWSSENASIFTTPKSIEEVFKFQENVTGKRSVVELTHQTKPLTTLFAAGSLVHHRYRTEEGLARSCMILAFHRSSDNPGQLIAPEHLKNMGKNTDSLAKHLLGFQDGVAEQSFIDILTSRSNEIAGIFDRLSDTSELVEQIPVEERCIGADEMGKWKEAATNAPTVEQIKLEANIIPLHKELSHKAFVKLLGKMMFFDKHGPLDLILYGDAREESRKWARNQIREKKAELLNKQLQTTWAEGISQPNKYQLLDSQQLQNLANELSSIALNQVEKGVTISEFLATQTISTEDAYRSTARLLLDLGEAIVRCEDQTAFLSTGLFIFWACDTLLRLEGENAAPKIKKIGQKLLDNYIAMALLVDQQMKV